MTIKSLLKKGLILTIIGTMSLGLVACGNEEKKNDTLDKETLVLGFDDTFIPMGFKGEDGEYTGFDIELAEAVGEKLGKKIELQPIDWQMKESELKNGNIDFIWNGLSITSERKKVMAFSKTYLDNRQVIITLADSNIENKKDLKGKKVAVQDESSAIDAIGDYADNFGELVTLPTNDECLRDLEAGRVDAVVADEILSKYYINLKGAKKYNVLDEDFGTEEYAVGMRKDDTKLLKEFNKAYNEVVEDGTASKISEKWFGEDLIVK